MQVQDKAKETSPRKFFNANYAAKPSMAYLSQFFATKKATVATQTDPVDFKNMSSPREISELSEETSDDDYETIINIQHL